MMKRLKLFALGALGWGLVVEAVLLALVYLFLTAVQVVMTLSAIVPMLLGFAIFWLGMQTERLSSPASKRLHDLRFAADAIDLSITLAKREEK